MTMYRSGRRDVYTMFFYTVVMIVFHAVIQEYILDKLQRKVNFSQNFTENFYLGPPVQGEDVQIHRVRSSGHLRSGLGHIRRLRDTGDLPARLGHQEVGFGFISQF